MSTSQLPQDTIYKERLNYEILLLKHIDTCTHYRYARDVREYIACVYSIHKILISDIRKELRRRLQNNEKYNILLEILEYIENYSPEDADLDKLNQLINSIKSYDKYLAKDLANLYNATIEYREAVARESQEVHEESGSLSSLARSLRKLTTSTPDTRDLRLSVKGKIADIILMNIIDTLNDLGLLLKHKDMYRGIVP